MSWPDPCSHCFEFYFMACSSGSLMKGYREYYRVVKTNPGANPRRRGAE